jgi:hypothetical protein
MLCQQLNGGSLLQLTAFGNEGLGSLVGWRNKRTVQLVEERFAAAEVARLA